jgi:uncharacterized LabA/DUF88 family protein
MTRTRIFIDFWNFQLSLNQQMGKHYRPDWIKLPAWLIDQAQMLTGSKLVYEEMRVYLSFNPRSAEDRRLKDWALNWLDRFPGVHVVATERKLRYAPYCPICHTQVRVCPHCGAAMAGTVEKGVDTSIVTDLLSLAWENAWELAILVTSDRDFIPAVELLNRKGLRVINAHFPPAGMDLARQCWGNIDLRRALPEIAR